ncbi:MAG: hypothetical protein M3Q56_03850 [Bacteroidota bacterium]|nr:hypothetical protein [Bacteroidota bacterium]
MQTFYLYKNLRFILFFVSFYGVAFTQMKASNQPTSPYKKSLAYEWLDIIQETSANDVDRYGARPPILSRSMAMAVSAMYDAWAMYDSKAVATSLPSSLRRPVAERTSANRKKAISYAVYGILMDIYPEDTKYLNEQMIRMGYDPKDKTRNLTTAQGVGNRVARSIIEMRHNDGANQLGNELGCNGKPYSDYTCYRPANAIDKICDPDRWQEIPFLDTQGKSYVVSYLTPHFYRVKPFGLKSASQFRPGPPPIYGSEQLKKEVDEVMHYNANLTPNQRAIVEFMRDGPRSTGQSGHWLKFAQMYQ